MHGHLAELTHACCVGPGPQRWPRGRGLAIGVWPRRGGHSLVLKDPGLQAGLQAGTTCTDHSMPCLSLPSTEASASCVRLGTLSPCCTIVPPGFSAPASTTHVGPPVTSAAPASTSSHGCQRPLTVPMSASVSAAPMPVPTCSDMSHANACMHALPHVAGMYYHPSWASSGSPLAWGTFPQGSQPEGFMGLLTWAPFSPACNCHGHAHDCYYDPEVDRRNASQNQDNVFQGGGVCIDCQVGQRGCQACTGGTGQPGALGVGGPRAQVGCGAGREWPWTLALLHRSTTPLVLTVNAACLASTAPPTTPWTRPVPAAVSAPAGCGVPGMGTPGPGSARGGGVPVSPAPCIPEALKSLWVAWPRLSYHTVSRSCWPWHGISTLPAPPRLLLRVGLHRWDM